MSEFAIRMAIAADLWSESLTGGTNGCAGVELAGVLCRG